MPNPFSDCGVSDEDIEREMNSAEVLRGKIELAEKAARYWRSVSPVETGEYRDSISVTVEGNDVLVGSDDDKANIIEFGAKDKPEFACRAKVQARFRNSE